MGLPMVRPRSTAATMRIAAAATQNAIRVIRSRSGKAAYVIEKTECLASAARAEREHGEHGGSHEGTERRKRKRAAPAALHAGRPRHGVQRGTHRLIVHCSHSNRVGPAKAGGPGPCSDLVRPFGCNATSPEIRARSFAHSRGAGQVVICDRSSWIRSAGFSLPIARIGARHFYRPYRGSPPCAQRTVGVVPRREATRSRHVTSRPAGAQRGRQAARSADEPIPRRRSWRPCPAAVSHEDSPASRTDGPSMQAEGLRSALHCIPG